MKGIAGTQTRGLQQQSELTVIDNTGAKVIEIITVPGYHGVARRSPKAAVGDMVIASVKKGTPAMRRQIVFAVSLGFVFTMVCYKSGSLIPCIIAHSLIDVFSLFAGDNAAADRIYVGATIVVSMIYCIYLCKAEKDEQ